MKALVQLALIKFAFCSTINTKHNGIQLIEQLTDVVTLKSNSFTNYCNFQCALC